MTHLRHYFSALLSNIEPSDERKELCKTLPGDVRDWLKDHDYTTAPPHTRLAGSYKRSTAIRNGEQDIKDVDILLFLPESNLDLTPSKVLTKIKKVLDGYPNGTVETTTQRRSIRLDFPDDDLHLDIVPSVAADGLGEPLQVPNKEQGKWIKSDPLGYGKSLSQLNQDNGERVVPLVKMIKAWRDEQMKARRPKSYVLEAMIYHAVDEDRITLKDKGWPQIVADWFEQLWDCHEDLFENGTSVPRVKDPQLGHWITQGWERTHFETFMRRVRDSKKASQKALDATADGDHDKAKDQWAKVFGDLWPSDDEARDAARSEASRIQPGAAFVGPAGRVLDPVATGVRSQSTRYHGGS